MNRGELEAAAKRMVSRPNLDQVDLDLALELAEDRLAPLLQSRWNHASVDMTVDTTALVALPADFAQLDAIRDSVGAPVDGSYFNQVADAAGAMSVEWIYCPRAGVDVKVWYFSELELGSADQDTNALLTNAPQGYLYPVAGELAVITRQFQLADRYFSLMDDHLRGLKKWRTQNGSAYDYANNRR